MQGVWEDLITKFAGDCCEKMLANRALKSMSGTLRQDIKG
jgi:hypothetical protein